jgi:hypothetical protein
LVLVQTSISQQRLPGSTHSAQFLSSAADGSVWDPQLDDDVRKARQSLLLRNKLQEIISDGKIIIIVHI